MPMEARTLTDHSVPRGRTLRINEHCLLVCSGVGLDNASRATQALRERGVGAVLSWGCAAGLQPNISAGTLVLPSIILAEDGQRLPVDSHLHRALRQRLTAIAEPCSGPLLTVDIPISTRAQKAALRQRHGAAALDMESSAIGITARRYRLPFAAVRTILDPAHQSLPAAATSGLQNDGSFHLGKGLAEVLRTPQDIIHLIRLGLNAKSAKKTLRRAATNLLLAPLI